LWQVKGRSRTTFDDMVRLDLRYARTYSLGTDLKILLATPRAVRHALVKKHRTAVGEVDPCSSAAWFDGWRAEPGARAPRGPSPVARAQSWLAAVGWRRHGLIDVDERPRTDRRVLAPRPRRGGERQTLGPPWQHTHHAARDARSPHARERGTAP